MSEISSIIITMLRAIFLNYLNPEENHLVKNRLQLSISISRNWTSQSPNLLLKACNIPKPTESIFKIISLLLDAGADPNTVDDSGRSALHYLALNECALSPWRRRPDYTNNAVSKHHNGLLWKSSFRR